MRLAIIAALYFDTIAHRDTARTQIKSAAASFTGLDPSFPFVCEVAQDHAGGTFLNVKAVATSKASLDTVNTWVQTHLPTGTITPSQGREVVVLDDGNIDANQSSSWSL